MARQRFDISSKWLLHNQGKGALRVAGLQNVHRCQPMPGEIAQNRRYPDGLLQAFLGNDPKPHNVLIEVATRPERRALKQALDDLALAYSALGHLPELVMFVLRPKGKFDGPPEPVLERCAERIEREAKPQQRTDFLVVAQVMAELRFPGLDLLTIFGGQKTMIESPLILRVKAEAIRESILEILKDRFESVPREVTKLLRAEMNEKKLKKLAVLAGKCSNLEAFRDALVS